MTSAENKALTLSLVVFGLFSAAACGCMKFADKGLKAEAIKGELTAEVPAAWFFYGPVDGQPAYDFSCGIDSGVRHGGAHSVSFFATDVNRDDQARLTQRFLSDRYNGKRVRFSGYMKTNQVGEWAGLWIRVDTASKQAYAFDDMEDRPLTGTVDWTSCEVVVDVPENAVTVYLGAYLYGCGQVWLDDCTFEVVGDEVPITNPDRHLGGYKRTHSIPEFLEDEPLNLDFEEENLFD